MNKLIDLIKSIYNIKELRDRILFTLTLLLVYRLGAQVVLPGVDSLALSDLSSRSDGGGLLGILNAFTGGAFANASVFALGIMPYISASIIVQLMTAMVPSLEQLKKEGEQGRKKINLWHCCSCNIPSLWPFSGFASRRYGYKPWFFNLSISFHFYLNKLNYCSYVDC